MKLVSKEVIREAGLRVKQFRKEQGLSPAEMAHRLDMLPSGYYKIERGEQFFSLRVLQVFTREFGISLDWLVFNNGPRYVRDKNSLADIEKKYSELRQQYDTDTAHLKKELEACKKKLVDIPGKEPELKGRYHPSNHVEVKELLDYFENAPTFFYEMMLQFNKHKEKNAADKPG